MNKQDFIMTELEAMAKDIILIVDEEKRSREQEEASRLEQVERRKHGENVGALSRMHDPNRILPELRYLETRLAAVIGYVTPSMDQTTF